MTDPRLFHTITVELCTGAGLFVALSIIFKLLSDGYLKRFSNKSKRIDRFAKMASELAEPTAYALGMGTVFFTFISIYTGMNAWPLDALLKSEAVHNKIMLTVFSQTTFITFIAIRTKFGKELWKNKMLVSIYSTLGIMGGAIIVLQNSVAGHIAGKGSIIDIFFVALNIDVTREFVLPLLVSIIVVISVTTALVITIYWVRRLKKDRVEKSRS